MCLLIMIFKPNSLDNDIPKSIAERDNLFKGLNEPEAKKVSPVHKIHNSAMFSS